MRETTFENRTAKKNPPISGFSFSYTTPASLKLNHFLSPTMT